MAARSNRTFICSVLFLDIIEYSRQPVADQIWLKDRFNSLLSAALSAVAPGDRIILDTGDGAAVSFLGDPEEALFSALSLREALAAPPPADGPQFRMRIGINLGPVKLVKDLNGQPNIIGDGINVAQRVMSFSEPGRILVSRSYYEVVSCLSEAYAKLFRFEGSRTDKHVREHEVYAVGAAAGLRPAFRAESSKTASAGGPVIDQLSRTVTQVRDNLRRKPWLGTALAVIIILAAALVMRGYRDEPQQAAATEAASGKANTAQPEKMAPPAAAAVTPSAADVPVKPVVQERALASLSILPWGEIYVDGRKVGVSPPLHEIEVKPGKRRIEIRNTTFPPYVETVDVAPGSRIKISYKFR